MTVKRYVWTTDGMRDASAYPYMQAHVVALDYDALVKRLKERGFWMEAPCVICGYDGDGYYQPDTHKCAAKAP